MTSCLSKHFLVWKGCLCALHHMMTKTFLNIHLEKYPQEKVVVRSIATKTIYQQTQEQTANSHKVKTKALRDTSRICKA